MIFPEGEIPDDTNLILQRFKDGAFSLSISTQTPLALYSIKGIKEMFPESWIKGYPGKVKVKLLDIISTNHLSLADKNELKDYCFQQISAELTKHKK